MEKEQLQQLADMISAKLLAVTKNALSFNDVMILTGLSKSHLYKLTCSNKIPHYKPSGKMVYFDRVEVENWMLSNRGASEEEIASMANLYQASTSNTQDKSRREEIKELIKTYCKSYWLTYNVGSYELKSLFENLLGYDIEHSEFVELMDECGFVHIKQKKHSNSLHYRIKVKEDDTIPPYYWGRGCESFLLHKVQLVPVSIKTKIKELICKYCKPSTQVYRIDSYQLKHLFQELSGFYIVHDDFIQIMQECGFDAVPYNKCEHCYYFKLEMSDDKKIPKWLRGIGYQSFKYKD